MRVLPWILLALVGCKGDPRPSPPTTVGPAAPAATTARPTLADARRGFVTRVIREEQDEDEPAPAPPAGVFELIRYDAPIGKLAAYVTPDPRDGARHPAIVWISGGDCNSIGEVWDGAPRANDQTAAAYRKAGIVMMFPSLRGGNDNPGRREGFYGEVDDVLAAADHLAALPYVDPQRIYLGGHSTGGTLAMLVAETSGRFRAVFAFGPIYDPRGYGGAFLYHDERIAKEDELRSPGRWLADVTSPLFVIEGVEGSSNIESLRAMRESTGNRLIHFVPVPGADHFSVLAPANDLLVAKVVADTGATSAITFNGADIARITDHAEPLDE